MILAAGGRVDPTRDEPHRFTPDCYDPGYRPHCLVCHLDEAHHPHYRTPAPRRPA